MSGIDGRRRLNNRMPLLSKIMLRDGQAFDMELKAGH